MQYHRQKASIYEAQLLNRSCLGWGVQNPIALLNVRLEQKKILFTNAKLSF